MDITALHIPGLLLITPRQHGDGRGVFFESYRARPLNDAVGAAVNFVQDNQSVSHAPGTVRGLHMQSPPQAQAKLVRCVSGEILDVVVDIRASSPHYGQHVAAVLNAQTAQQIYIPEGFLHGFVTRAPNTIVAYKCSNYYSAAHEVSVRFDSKDLGIDWGYYKDAITLSGKDQSAQDFSDFESPFT